MSASHPKFTPLSDLPDSDHSTPLSELPSNTEQITPPETPSLAATRPKLTRHASSKTSTFNINLYGESTDLSSLERHKRKLRTHTSIIYPPAPQLTLPSDRTSMPREEPREVQDEPMQTSSYPQFPMDATGLPGEEEDIDDLLSDFDDSDIEPEDLDPASPRAKPVTRSSRLKKMKWFEDMTGEVVLQYWKQAVNVNREASSYRRVPSRTQIKKYVNQILSNREVENKDKVHEEVNFILHYFKQRMCRNYCRQPEKFYQKARKALWKVGQFIGDNKEYCICGLEKMFHSEDALKSPCDSWSIQKHTELVMPWNFGNVDIPGHYTYLETPGGTRKFLRLDDSSSSPRAIWELLIHHWHFKRPNLVLSITGGDVTALQTDNKVYNAFRDGLIKTAVNTHAWIFTDGLHHGSSREVADIFQEDLRRSEWAEVEDHTNIPLIGFTPWSIVADRAKLMGIHVGSDEAVYNFNNITNLSNALDPYHVCYLFPDNGTSGAYKHEPTVRRNLEKFIKKHTTLEVFGSKDVNTPLVILVVGGDRFTMDKVHFAIQNSIPVVIVNGSGAIAEMLADIYKALETRFPRSQRKSCEWSDDEDVLLAEYLVKYERMGMIEEQKQILKEIMSARHLIEVFGRSDDDERNMDRAILKATFGGITEISAQLNLTLAMDRVDVARETIFTEARKNELRNQNDMLQSALLAALQSGRTEFANLLIDQDCGGELEFDDFLTVRRLYILHNENLKPTSIMGKTLRSLCRRDTYGAYVLGEEDLLPQVGRIIYQLMGNHYKLVYQQQGFRQVQDTSIPYSMANENSEEAVWHLFLWAVLADKREIAELFLFESSCKMGCALVAHKMLMELALVAEGLRETELADDLRVDAEYFQDLAVDTLDNLYEFSREEAYSSLVAVLPFHWGQYVNPLSIADDGGAMRFIGHACCQTYLNLVWMKYMDLDTSMWKLLPIFALTPFLNIPFIVFDKHNLAFGSYHHILLEDDHQSAGEDMNESHTHLDTMSLDSRIQDSPDNYKAVTKKRLFLRRRIKFAWFCLQNYYTAPVNKFIFNMTSYIIFLGIFTHFVLTLLSPIKSVSEISNWEWVIYVWAVCISIEELKQITVKRSSGPLHNLRWVDFDPAWRRTFHWYERLSFVIGIYRVTNWLSDRWNKVDCLMLIMFYVSVVLRFTLDPVDFGLVRLSYIGTLMIFFLRILRYGYIVQDIGPRIITIKALMKDLFQFLLILSVFILSFGIAFQALLDPNRPSSWELLVNVLWRPYWQMYGELMTDDVTSGMGRETLRNVTCTRNRTLASLEPEQYEFCYEWMAPLMLGGFMLITNILLLNLLIAIFSHSFDKIENESKTIWRYHMYDLVHEYYNIVWLPPPLNLLSHLINIIKWLLRWPRRWAYTIARRNHRKDIEATKRKETILFQVEKRRPAIENILERETEEEMKKDCCSWFYDSPFSKHHLDTSHFRQEEFYRSEDLEEKAYKRYLRSKGKKSKADVKLYKLMNVQQQRLQLITSDLQDIKHQRHVATAQAASPTLETKIQRSGPSSSEVKNIKAEVKRVHHKVDDLGLKLSKLLTDIEPIVTHMKKQAKKDK